MTRAPLVAAGLMALQTLALVVVGIVAATDASARAISFAVTLWVLAACCGALAWLLSRGRTAARTPTLVWNVLLVPCGFSVAQGGAAVAGWAMIAAAAVTFAAALMLPAHHPTDGGAA